MKQAFKIIWSCDPRGFISKLTLTVFVSLLPLANLYVLKVIVDTVTANIASSVPFGAMMHEVVPAVALFCSVTLLSRIIGALNNYNNEVLSQRLSDYVNTIIQKQSARLDMSYYDDPTFHDTLHRAQQEASFRPVRIMENMVSLFGAVLSLAAVASMLFFASWKIVLVMVVAVVPSLCARLYKSQKVYDFRRQTTQLQRRASYYGALLTSRMYAKEIRTYGLSGYLRGRYEEIRTTLLEKLKKIARSLAVLDSLSALIEAAALAVVLLALIAPVVAGALTIGSFVMLFEAFRRGMGYLNSLVAAVGGLNENRLFVNNLTEFMAMEPAIVSPDDAVAFPERVEVLEFRDITFAYPGMRSPLLSNFSFVARRGEVAYLEGENGFGKSTLLKLALRLYDPQEGAVLINGVDIRRYNLSDLRRNVSALFQDYVNFYFTVRESVAFGDIHSADDAKRLEEALLLSGADKVVEGLSNGLDTQLGRQFVGGEELSMGQWQRVALARQLYSGSPVLLFDEPTAWMDGAARERFAETLQKLCGEHVVIVVRHV
ncbi:MAG: ABC transporter ATP-binding protein [Bacteroidales bacterium]|nr:ABC transporter ATP-binding protein [Bacteroidales bacterium]